VASKKLAEKPLVYGEPGTANPRRRSKIDTEREGVSFQVIVDKEVVERRGEFHPCDLRDYIST
jgi:hypothetical protein